MRVAAIVIALCSSLNSVPAAVADDATAAVLAGIAAYNRGDYATAFALLSREAAAGNSDAEVNLGYLYARGHGVGVDQLQALRLYQRSAEQGNGEGMNAMGYKYQFGTGIKPDLHKAIEWYCLAIGRGNSRALNNLAWMQHDGTGMPRDIAEARSLWRQSAERGDVNALYSLGASLLSDEPRDAQKGMRWLGRAAEQGQELAQRELRGRGYGGPLPPVVDSGIQMRIQSRDAVPGHARICGETIS